MDELDLLKKDWQNKEHNYPTLSYNEIYKMIHSKSSNIVKWIFIISILEFALWTFLSFFLKDAESMERFRSYNMEGITLTLTIAGYAVLAYFFYLFFRNYKRISTTASIKNLMENILRTRRTVKQYVAFNLIFLVISTIVVLYIQLDQDQVMIAQAQEAAANGEAFKYYAVIIITTIIGLAIVIGILLLFYWLIYGILLKRLNRNYRELKKIEQE
ncbi:hypothetical protein [Winogradskyella sp. 3972H.M.0a.05]|uniref:hypothetical protein n=1 Tax=Winogradskyella sp. 3972H.M.0a.05 TaxID=2950277 RepID=UPI0033947161